MTPLVVTPKTPVPPAAGVVTPPPGEDADLPPLPQPDVKAVSAILIDAVSGQVLYEKNADARRPMASTTKVMTALLFCESVKDGEIITASPKACAVKESSLHLKPGEKLTSHDMLRAILMRSANDGCVAAAEYVAGSEAAFVEKMNQKAAELGATNTHFMNPHGLNDPKHYTTARDLATIGRAAMQDERIRDVVRTEKYKIVRSINTHDVLMRNHSHFLGHYDGADGVKTGWTIPAGHCYVGSATRNGWQLISVVLKSPNYVHETAELMDFGFHNFAPHEIAHAGEVAGECLVQNGDRPTVPVSVPKPLQFVSRKGETPVFSRHITVVPAVAPVKAGSSLGSLEVLLNGRQIAASPLVATEAISAARPIAQAQGGFTGRFAALIGIFAAVLVSLRYGTRQKTRFATFAKGPRRRRRRLAPSLRDDDYGG
ncbi:MAG: D-alanyl-D-alanine carboxypeptidase [Chthonomonadaceae bacterium]|nr:D-alanyl-D-alanine carboxypeptidase [Chthonomonadaceae bacterium]